MKILFAQEVTARPTPVPPLHVTAKKNGWLRIYRGAYLDPRGQDLDKVAKTSMHAAKVIALAASTPVAVISGLSAAVMHDLPLLQRRIPDRVQVSRSSKSAPGKWVTTRESKLSDEEIAEVSGVRCTSILRTIRDLVDQVELDELLALADAAKARGVDLTPLQSIRRHGRYFRWLVQHASDRSESFAESRSRFLLLQAGMELPILQPSLYSAQGLFLGRGDFATKSGLVGEFDGKLKYEQFLRPGETLADAVMKEKRRENSIRDAGFEVFRWDWQLLNTPKVFIERWKSALSRAALLPPPSGSIRIEQLRPPTVTLWEDVFTWTNPSETPDLAVTARS
ncbi:hypothetical protein [Gulosibacter chungangensis]|uniref:Type IV toxin-antitoxin system AbiEi family antitoxin domain-containing protein n=1 Tax=Gulosibacter chungangensis TaxID=979746 RepID=A0A7J5BES9_9MICO|nr:hypothetical protein [Gulosibacter chungangensis]KAB1644766.1 hypothetical protein F8O05_00330 [Gulosibacter chungangensis]